MLMSTPKRQSQHILIHTVRNYFETSNTYNCKKNERILSLCTYFVSFIKAQISTLLILSTHVAFTQRKYHFNNQLENKRTAKP